MTASTGFAGRFTRRMRARRMSRARLLLVLLLAGGLLAAAGWVVMESRLLGVTSVKVAGASRVPAAEVVKAAAISRGSPLARLDTSAVAARVGRLPAVRTAEVRRSWPRSVSIVVHERVPAAVRPQGSAYLLVDRSGVVFGTVDRRHGLPVVSAPVDAGPGALRAALDALEAVPTTVRDQVRSVRAASPDEVTFQLTHGRSVVWGSTDRPGRKGAVLAVLLSRKATLYDVSAPDTPTTRR